MRVGSQQKQGRLDRQPEARPLFGPYRPLRSLRVLVDHELLSTDYSRSKAGLLNGLLTHELIEKYRYADDGPPAGEPRLDDKSWPGDWVEGWAVLGDYDATYDAYALSWADKTSRASGTVWGNAYDVAANDVDADAYRSEAPSDAARLRKRDALAAEVADAIRADLFITRRDYLHAVSWPLAAGVTFVTPEQALPFVSLYLRTQGEFYFWIWDRGSSTVNRGLFYWIGTWELLPAAWRWFAACAQHSHATTSDHLAYTGRAALQRVDRALELRDLVHRALNQPQDNDVAEDALVSFDSALVFLMGALDAVARVAHQTLQLPGRAYNVGWQRPDWLARVRATAPDLAGIVAPGTPGGAVLTVLKALRNTVHSAGLLPVGVGTARMERQRTLIDLSAGIEDADLTAVLTAMDMLGGRQRWGVEQLVPAHHFADPGMLLDQLLPPALRLLNDLMGNTPVEELPGVELTDQQCHPPSDPHNTFSERRRESVRWQLGL